MTTRHGFAEGTVPESVTDRILLRTGHGISHGQIVHGWVGTWPPPPVLVRITRKLNIGSPDSRLVNPLEQDAGVIEQFRAHGGFDVDEYRLASASKIEHPARPDERWCRGAEYIRVPTCGKP